MCAYGETLRTFYDPKVAFRAGTELLRCLLVSLSLLRRESNIIAVDFDKNCPLLQSGFVGLNLAGGPGQKTPTEGLNRWHR
jgi:hypothetical protein